MMKNKMKFILPGLIIVLAVVCFFIWGSREESYRNIQVLEISGSAKVDRSDSGELDVYEGMRLQSGDKIYVAEESWLQLKMDEDKYALVEPGSVLTLEATGSSTDSRTVIHLESGAVSSRLENELSDGSAYEVNTPDSTMAVRGTVFRVEVRFDGQGVSYVTVAVYGGKVEARLIHPDGKVDDQDTAVMITDGTSVLIAGDDKLTRYITKDAELELEELELNVLMFLREAVRADQDLAVFEEEIEKLIQSFQESTETTEEMTEATEEMTETTEEITEAVEEMTETTEEMTEAVEEMTETTEEITEATEEMTETTEEIMEYHVVTFVYQDQVFATQTVEHNHAVKRPVLQPTASGSWKFVFTTPVTKDTVIEWSAN